MLTELASRGAGGLFINVPDRPRADLAGAALPARDGAPHRALRPHRRRNLDARHDRARVRLRARGVGRLERPHHARAPSPPARCCSPRSCLTEMRAEQPITPLHLFASRERSGAYVARMLVVGGMFSMFFFLTQYLQGVRRLQRARGRHRVPADDRGDVRDGPRRPAARSARRQHPAARRRDCCSPCSAWRG